MPIMLLCAPFVTLLRRFSVAARRAGPLLGCPFLAFNVSSMAAQSLASHPSEPVQQLVAEVIYNELHDRACDSFWEYRSERVAGDQSVVREQVETADGPLFRVIEDHGNPLDASGRLREDQRLRELVERPGAMDKVKREHEQDEERMRKVIAMMPSAFLYSYDGISDDDQVRISFRPDPAFVPSTYEARIVHALGGSILVNRRLKRLVDMNGRLVERVDFGYGILGHVEKDGTFEIRREQVSQTRWKTDLVDVHIQGKLLLFKNITRDQCETRSNFRPVPHEIGLATARALLVQAEADLNQASAAHGEH